jgi:hypothetical protein
MAISRRDGQRFTPPDSYEQSFYRELKPISADYQAEALRVNGLDRDRLLKEGESPESAMPDAYRCSAGVAACSARTPKCPFIPQTTDQEIRRIPIQNRCDRARTRVAIHGHNNERSTASQRLRSEIWYRTSWARLERRARTFIVFWRYRPDPNSGNNLKSALAVSAFPFWERPAAQVRRPTIGKKDTPKPQLPRYELHPDKYLLAMHVQNVPRGTQP